MKQRNALTVMRKLAGLVRPLAGYMCLAVLMGLVGHLCATFITILGGYALLSLLGLRVSFSVSAVFLCMIAFGVIRGLLRYGEQACNHYIAFKLLALIRDKVFRALRRLCPAKLEGRDKGNLISIITSDIELLEVFYAHTISPAAIWLLFTVFMTIYIGSFHATLGVIALLAYLTVGIVIPCCVAGISGDSGLRFRTESGELAALVLDSLRGLSEVLQYGQGENRIRKMNSKTEELLEEEGKMKAMTGRNMAVTNTVIMIFDITLLAACILLFRKGDVGFDGVLLPTLALFASFGPSVALANLGSTLQNTFAAGNRVLDILEEMPVTEEIAGKTETGFTGARAREVTFAYGEETILDGFSAEIAEGRITGISGKSGSGKSTLLKLMMRFWKVSRGEIVISGRNIEEINTSNLREMESFVTQETHLFHDSIKNNIRIAKLDASDEEIQQACRKASIHDFIMTLPEGYDTPVGELGETLSGGERQRIGLARAFLHQAPLMLLDEPTSNLDSLNEAVVLQSLVREREGKTIVLVSHRESTMRIADSVIEVAQGRVS